MVLLCMCGKSELNYWNYFSIKIKEKRKGHIKLHFETKQVFDTVFQLWSSESGSYQTRPQGLCSGQEVGIKLGLDQPHI